MLSVVTTFIDGSTVEVRSCGRESFVESDAALDTTRALRTSVCYIGGRAARMPMKRFTYHMETCKPFARLMRHNVRAVLFNIQQISACNQDHGVLQRCARWLLATAERVDGATFDTTHETVSMLLGVRRPGVSEAFQRLADMGAIEYRRGQVRVSDLSQLESMACECYAASREEFVRALNP
jgi:CRP-like cAMP-binding protein